MKSRIIRVLVVDDSPMFRQLILKGLSTDPNIEVIVTACDAYDASEKIVDFEPDVVTCDVEMPKMNGIEFVKRLMPQYPVPVIMVSSLTDKVFDAIQAGAVDFVGKPNLQSKFDIERFIVELIDKVKAAANSKVFAGHSTSENSNNDDLKTIKNFKKILVIGASTGGTQALSKFLSNMPKDIPGMVIVQHIPPKFSKMFADRLNSTLPFEVKEAETGDLIERGRVLIAPGDKHMRVVKFGMKYKVECFEGDKVSGHCPSVDVLFDSAAKNIGKDAVGIILTGMGYDGAKGMLAMKRKGAHTVGQDEKSSVVYGMPRAAYDLGAVDKQVSLEELPKYLISYLKD